MLCDCAMLCHCAVLSVYYAVLYAVYVYPHAGGGWLVMADSGRF